MTVVWTRPQPVQRCGQRLELSCLRAVLSGGRHHARAELPNHLFGDRQLLFGAGGVEPLEHETALGAAAVVAFETVVGDKGACGVGGHLAGGMRGNRTDGSSFGAFRQRRRGCGSETHGEYKGT